MEKVITAIVVLHFVVSVLRRVFQVPVKMIPMVFTRYFYVVVHELSHLVIGILVGCGVYDLVLKETAESSGAYITKYKSPFKILWVNFGEVFLSLAGPLLPPVVFYGFAYGIVNDLHTQIFMAIGFGLLLIVAYSSQRLYFIVGGLALVLAGGVLDTAYFTNILMVLLVWGLLGMVDELFAIRGFDNKGSDMAMFTKAILGASHPVLSRVLYCGIQVYYLIAIGVIVQLLAA